MTSNKTAFAVGLFVIIGLALAIVAIIWLGMSNYFDKGRYYVAFFDESVQGLDKDSPVKYRGVSIGRVHSVRVAPDATLIEVVLSIEQKMNLESDMVAQLKSVGITGIMFIEIDRKKEGEPDYLNPITFKPEYPIVKTRASGMKMFMDGMDDILQVINQLDTKGISEKLKSSVDIITQMIEDAQLKDLASDIKRMLTKTDAILDVDKWHGMMDSLEKTSISLNTLIVNANQPVANIDKAITTLSANLTQTLANINKSINTLSANANKTVTNVNNIVADMDKIIAGNEKDVTQVITGLKDSVKNADVLLEDSSKLIRGLDLKLSDLQRHLIVTLQQLEKTSENLNRFSDNIAGQPSQLIFGEPVPSKEADYKK